MKNKEYFFGYDLDNVQAVEAYVKANYKECEDFEVYVGYGDDVMNALEVLNDDINKDEKFLELVSRCQGQGDYEEEDDFNEAEDENGEDEEREIEWMKGHSH